MGHKVKELKELVKEAGFKPEGNKGDLINVLMNNKAGSLVADLLHKSTLGSGLTAPAPKKFDEARVSKTITQRFTDPADQTRALVAAPPPLPHLAETEPQFVIGSFVTGGLEKVLSSQVGPETVYGLLLGHHVRLSKKLGNVLVAKALASILLRTVAAGREGRGVEPAWREAAPSLERGQGGGG